MGEGGHLPLVSICAVVSYIYRSIIALVFSYKLTILNGVSLITYSAKSSLLSLAVLNGGSICLWYLYVHWSLYILII